MPTHNPTPAPKRGRPPLIPGSRIVQVPAYLTSETVEAIKQLDPAKPFRENMREVVRRGLKGRKSK